MWIVSIGRLSSVPIAPSVQHLACRKAPKSATDYNFLDGRHFIYVLISEHFVQFRNWCANYSLFVQRDHRTAPLRATVPSIRALWRRVPLELRPQSKILSTASAICFERSTGLYYLKPEANQRRNLALHVICSWKMCGKRWFGNVSYALPSPPQALKLHLGTL